MGAVWGRYSLQKTGERSLQSPTVWVIPTYHPERAASPIKNINKLSKSLKQYLKK